MIEISQATWSADKKNIIRFDGKCVMQVVKDIPPRSVINQACYIFFKTYTKSRIKEPEIYFLTLLYSTSQIVNALAHVKFKEGDIVYVIKCCEKDINNFEQIQIKDNSERIALSTNAINSLI